MPSWLFRGSLYAFFGNHLLGSMWSSPPSFDSKSTRFCSANSSAMGSQDGDLLATNSARHPSQSPTLTMSAHGATIEPAKVFEVLAAMPPGVLFASAKEGRKDPYRDGNYPGVTSGILVERPLAGPESSRTGSPTTSGDRQRSWRRGTLSVRARPRRGRGVLQKFWGRKAHGTHARQRGKGPSFEPFRKPRRLEAAVR